jgi:hypothetical protein
MDHSPSHDNYFIFWTKNTAIQEIGYILYVYKYVACTCKCYHHIGTYVQECTHTFHMTTILHWQSHSEMFGTRKHTLPHQALPVARTSFPHHWQRAMTTSGTTLVFKSVYEQFVIYCSSYIHSEHHNKTMKPRYKSWIVFPPLTSGSCVHTHQLFATFTSTCHKFSNVIIPFPTLLHFWPK